MMMEEPKNSPSSTWSSPDSAHFAAGRSKPAAVWAYAAHRGRRSGANPNPAADGRRTPTPPNRKLVPYRSLHTAASAWRIATLHLTGLLLSGCHKTPSDHPAPTATTAAAPARTGHGIIRGRAVFAAPIPAPQMVSNGANCIPGEKHPPIYDETIVVNPNSTLRNVFVYLEGAPASSGAGLAPVTLDQKNCQYVPHALALQVDQPLIIRSSDATIHNVHVFSDTKPMNRAMAHAGDQFTTRFKEPQFVAVKCDVHPWMNAWIGVFDSRFFALTDNEGAFEIRNVPPGTYTLVAHHEQFEEQRRTITITNDKPVEVIFTYKP
jgi:plastocyanin